MTKMVQISVTITLSIVTIFVTLLILLTLRVGVLVPKVDSALSSIQAVELNTTRTEAELAGLLNQTRHIAEDEHKAQQQQISDIHYLVVKAGKALDDADTAIKETGEVAPQLTSSLQTITQDIHSTMGYGQNLLIAATDDVDNPAIKESLDNLSAAANSAKDATEMAAGTMKDIRGAVDYEISELMKPVKKTKVALEFIATIAGKFFGY